LLLPAFGADARKAERNRTRAALALQAKHRMLVIAPLASFTQERFDAMARQLKIGGFHGIPMTFMQNGLWDSTVRRFPNAIAAWRGGRGTVAIAQVELRQGGKGVYASVIDMALMSITAEFLPVESSYERTVADFLVMQGRSFMKPLCYQASADLVLPDFIFTDTLREVPMEVFGRDDARYLQRKEEKSAHYDEQYGKSGWWSWDAASHGGNVSSVPSFPPARGSSGKYGDKADWQRQGSNCNEIWKTKPGSLPDYLQVTPRMRYTPMIRLFNYWPRAHIEKSPTFARAFFRLPGKRQCVFATSPPEDADQPL
jgi:hypothetical protein